MWCCGTATTIGYFGACTSVNIKISNEMQTDFLPNFILCNTTQLFVRSLKGANHSSRRSTASTGKPYFYCRSHDLTMAYQGLAGLYHDFFGIPHMFAIAKLLGSRSLPGIIRALLDHISSKITAMVPKITALQEALPKSIGLLSFDGGISGLLYKSNLNSGSVLEYALAFTSASLDRHYSKWSATPKTCFIDITTSKDFYRVFSGIQYSYLEDSITNPSKKREMLGDSVAWAGCTVM